MTWKCRTVEEMQSFNSSYYYHATTTTMLHKSQREVDWDLVVSQLCITWEGAKENVTSTRNICE